MSHNMLLFQILVFEDWIYALFESCITASQSSKESDVKMAVAQHLGIAKVRQVKNIMIELGLKLECNDGKGHRYVRYDIDRDGVLKPIKLKAWIVALHAPVVISPCGEVIESTRDNPNPKAQSPESRVPSPKSRVPACLAGGGRGNLLFG